MTYKLSRKAARDIEALLEASLADFGSVQTALYASALSKCLELLAENPLLGASAEDIRHGYRRFPHASHIVFYVPRAADILVVRVLHQRMDAVRHLGS